MRLLLDTHALLWAIGKPERLSRHARNAVARTHNEVFVSVASAWELAIKAALGHARLPADLEESLDHRSYRKLTISFSHAAMAARLPLHHRDPFDRMLIAQALSEGMTLVTRDERFSAYGVAILEA